MGKKICVSYQGMGPINTNMYRKMTKKILNKKSVKLIGMRDKQAMEYAKEMGIKEDKMILSSDMIFMMKPPAPENNCRLQGLSFWKKKGIIEPYTKKKGL